MNPGVLGSFGPETLFGGVLRFISPSLPLHYPEHVPCRIVSEIPLETTLGLFLTPDELQSDAECLAERLRAKQVVRVAARQSEVLTQNSTGSEAEGEKIGIAVQIKYEVGEQGNEEAFGHNVDRLEAELERSDGRLRLAQ